MTTHTAVDLDPATTPTISVEEFAKIAGISRGSAYNGVESGEIPALRFGRRIRISTAVVRRMLDMDGPDAAA